MPFFRLIFAHFILRALLLKLEPRKEKGAITVGFSLPQNLLFYPLGKVLLFPCALLLINYEHSITVEAQPIRATYSHSNHCPTKHYGSQSHINSGISNTSPRQLELMPGAESGTINKHSYLGLRYTVISQPSHLSGTLSRLLPTPPPGSPLPPSPTRRPPPAPPGPLLHSTRGARERRAAGSLEVPHSPAPRG